MATPSKKELAIDENALRQAVTNPKLRANSDWCVACGASAAAGPELPRVVEQQMAQDPEILKSLVRDDFVSRLSERLSGTDLNADWCVACGASAATAPGDLVTNPASISDELINDLAARLLTRQ